MFRRSDAHPVWNHNRLNEPHTEVRWRTNDEEEGDEATGGNVAIFCFIIIIIRIIIIGYGLCVVCCMIELCNYLSIWWHHCDDLIQISLHHQSWPQRKLSLLVDQTDSILQCSCALKALSWKRKFRVHCDVMTAKILWRKEVQHGALSALKPVKCFQSDQVIFFLGLMLINQ